MIAKKTNYLQINASNIYDQIKTNIQSIMYTSDELISGIKILILDDFAVKLIDQIYTQSTLQALGITLTMSIEKASKLQKMLNTKAIYLIQNTSDNIKNLILSMQTFNKVYINFIDTVSDKTLENIAQQDKNLKIQSIKCLNINFIPILPNFLISNNIINVFKFLQPKISVKSVRYQYGDANCEVLANQFSDQCIKLTKMQNDQTLNTEIIFLNNSNGYNTIDLSFLELLNKFKNLTIQSQVDSKQGQIPMSFFTQTSTGQKLLLSDPFAILTETDKIKVKQSQKMKNLQQNQNNLNLQQIEALNQETMQKQNEIKNILSLITELKNEILSLLVLNNLIQQIQSQKVSKLDESDLQQILSSLKRCPPQDSSWNFITQMIKLTLQSSLIYCQEKHFKNNQQLVETFIKEFQQSFSRNQVGISINFDEIKNSRMQFQQRLEYYNLLKQGSDQAVSDLVLNRVASSIDSFDMLQFDDRVQQLYLQIYTLISIQALNCSLSSQYFPVTQLFQRQQIQLSEKKDINLVILFINNGCSFSQCVQLLNNKILSEDIQKLLRKKVLIVSDKVI